MKKENNERNEILKQAYKQAMEQSNKDRKRLNDLQSFIDKLEKKETYNGQELGLLFMVDALNEIRAMKNKEQVKVDKEILNRYFASIPKLDKEQNDIFTTYRFLNIWLSNNYYMSLAYIQQRTGKYNYLMGKVRDIYFTETAYNFFAVDFKELPKEKNEQKAKHYNDFYKPFCLLKYTKESPRQERNKEHIADAIKTASISYNYLLCYNKVLDILAEFYKIPDLELFKYDNINYIPAEFKHYNKFLKLIDAVIEQEQITNEQKKNKLELFKEIFKPLNYDFEIPKHKIEMLKEKLSMTDFNLFANRKDDIINTLLF